MKLKPVGSNQTEIERNGVTVLFSYETPVAAFVTGRGMLVTDTHYSKTTSCHISKAAARWGATKRETVRQETINQLA